MDEGIPTRDRFFCNYPMMDVGPPDKKRRVDLGCSGNPTMIESIVNATSNWPLNSLNASAVLPNYEESVASKHNNFPNQASYFETDRYLGHQNSPKMERNFGFVDRSTRSNTKKECSRTTRENNTDSYRQVFDHRVPEKDFSSRLDVATSQELKEKYENAPEKKSSTVLKDKEVKDEPMTTGIKQEQVDPEQDNAKEDRLREEETKPEASQEQANPSSSTNDKKEITSDLVKTEVDAVKEEMKADVKKDTSDNDPYPFLDWKDGIATLPGSNLKFKMNEFGTLEMVSTVETEKGEYEWSTAAPAPATATAAGATDSSTGTGTAPADLMKGPPDAGHVLCCEVCGVYGLPQDFCSSGRFCSLSCVGSYTGRRNKGREFVRNVNTIEGKITKKKKKSKGKKGINGKPLSPVMMEGDDLGFSDKTSDTVIASSPKTKGPREKGKGKNKAPLIEPSGTCLTASMVPYNFSKPFTWTDYLYMSGTKPVPISVFKQENPDINVFPMPCEEFKKNMKLEAVDPKHPSYICVCTIVRVKGARLRLHFDGWSECYDVWTNADSPFIFPVGWCEKNGQTLHPPRSFSRDDFNWQKYLKKQGAAAAPEQLFKPVSKRNHAFDIGMKLEAIDRKNPDLICVATVTNVIGNYFLVHFDEWDDTYDYWCQDDCPYIHPVGWCESTGRKLNPPNDDEVDTFTWKAYLKSTGALAVPAENFKTRPLPTFKPNQKLECVDKRNPSLIRSATVADVQHYRVRVHFDGWDDVYDDWFDSDSTDIHPVSYCEKTGHPLEPPLTTADKISSVACPTPGCKGIGHVKGAKYSSHHSTFGCPYSLQNLNKESCLVDRLSTNSMTEESDWSYTSKNKSSVGAVRRGELSTEGVCPTPGCDGSGHIGGHWRTHQSSAGCPLNEANINRPRVPVPIQPAPPKTTSQVTTLDIKKKVPPLTIVTTNSTMKTVAYVTAARRPSREIKREKPSQESLIKSLPSTKENIKDKPQPVTPVYTQRLNDTYPPNDYHDSPTPPPPPPSNDRKRSRERLRMSKWTVDDVVKHVTSLGCSEQAKLFSEQNIDGESFLLLTQDDIVNIMKIKLGPALKIYKSIPKL